MSNDKVGVFANEDDISAWWAALAEVDRIRWLVAWQGRGPDGDIEAEQELLDTLPAPSAGPNAGAPFIPDARFVAFLDARATEWGQ